MESYITVGSYVIVAILAFNLGYYVNTKLSEWREFKAWKRSKTSSPKPQIQQPQQNQQRQQNQGERKN